MNLMKYNYIIIINRYWMAPEVIMCDPESPTSYNASYNSKADIWSIGITGIEIADKNPPLSDIHPMRALTLIPTSDLGLAKPKNWSKLFVEFIAICLTKDPNKRPSAEDLLKHPFLQRAKNLRRDAILADMIQKSKMSKEKTKLGIPIDDDEEFANFDQIVPEEVSNTLPPSQLNKQGSDMNPQVRWIYIIIKNKNLSLLYFLLFLIFNFFFFFFYFLFFFFFFFFYLFIIIIIAIYLFIYLWIMNILIILIIIY